MPINSTPVLQNIVFFNLEKKNLSNLQKGKAEQSKYINPTTKIWRYYFFNRKNTYVLLMILYIIRYVHKREIHIKLRVIDLIKNWSRF